MRENSVLVVEDEPTLLRQLTTYLSSQGLDARGVGRLQEAADALAAEPVAVVVTDIMLPGGSGLELLRRRDEIARDTEVILITGAPNLPSAEEAVRLGAFDYLEKPVRLAELKRRVEKALERVRLVIERRDHLAEIGRLNALLARKLESSSSELSDTREQLAVASVLAELGRLTAAVCHELANPLTSLLAASEFLQGIAGPPPPRLLGMIQNGATRCGRITQMLLDVRRVGLTPAGAVSLAIAAERAKAELAGPLEREKARWSVAIPADLPPVLAEHELLVGCLVNLAKNALDAMAGSPVREIRIAASRAAGGVEVVFEDTGPGFAPAALEHALEPFFTTTPADRGTGLGLAIVAATVRSWGGDIAIANAPAGGARISLKLAEAKQGSTGREIDLAVPALTGRTLLIAAPPGDVRELLELAAGRWGASPAVAGSAAELLLALRAGTPDVLLIDATELDADLPSLFAELQRAHPRAAGRVVPMASVHRDPRLGAFLESFPGPILTKPFGMRRLREVLDVMLGL